jgi:hypothetical protein
MPQRNICKRSEVGAATIAFVLFLTFTNPAFATVINRITVAGNQVTNTGIGTSPAMLSAFCYGTPNAYGFIVPLFGLGQIVHLDCASAVGTPSAGLPMASRGTLRNLAVAVAEPCTTNSEGAFTTYVNGTATALACKVGTRVSCRDGIHQVPVKAGDLVEIRFGPNEDISCPNTPRATLEKK